MPVLTLVIRGLRPRLLAINLASIKPWPSWPPSKRHQTQLCLSWDPLFLKTKTIWEGVNPGRDEGLFIPSFLKEALGGDGNLQIKMTRTMQAQEKCDRKCFICQSMDHLMRDHYQGKNGTGPLQPKGPPQNKSACEMAKASLPGQAMSHGAPPK